MVLINAANLCCHAVYSVLASFFPQEAKAKRMSDELVGVVFAVFALVIFLASPFVGKLMTTHGKKTIYCSGLVLVAGSTVAFSVASLLPEGPLFACWCLVMRLLQGVGSAMEETAAYAIIADMGSAELSFLMGITEISTGFGYMIGPPLGGILFSAGGFTAPFLVLGIALLPAAALTYYRLPNDMRRSDTDESDEPDVPMRTLLHNPQVIVIAMASVLANSDYAFLEPTLGDHLISSGLTTSQAGIGAIFSVSSVCYTISCPLVGLLASHKRAGPRPMIVGGLLLQLLGFLLIGPSPLLRLERAAMGPIILALILFGLGESMSMTPVMDDMMHSCGEKANAAVNSLSSLLASSFSLGQMIGPLMGTFLTSRYSFPMACTVMSFGILVHTAIILIADSSVPRRASPKDGGYLELTSIPPAVESAQED